MENNKTTKVKEIQLKTYQTKLWIENQRKKYKDETVVFILPNGKKV